MNADKYKESDQCQRLIYIKQSYGNFGQQQINRMQTRIKFSYFNLLLLTFLLQLIHKVQSICSINCPANACNGTNYNLCQSCIGIFNLDSTKSPNCYVYPPSGYVLEASTAQGTISVTESASTSTTPCGALANIHGWMSPTDSLEISYPGGITRSYTMMKMIFGLVTKGTWAGSEAITIKFVNANQVYNRIITTHEVFLNGQCSADNTDYQHRIQIDYPSYTTQNTTLTWTINITNYVPSNTTTGMWAWKQFLLAEKACEKTCLTCTTSPIVCTSCTPSGTYQSFLISANSSCVPAAQCPSNTYPNTSNHICTNCPSNCQNCTTGTLCTKCASGFYLQTTNASYILCVSTCTTGYFGDTSVTPNKCSACPNQCTACSSASSCSACTTSGTYQSYLSGSSCIAGASCPGGTYPQSSTHICTSCNSSCTACSQTADNCTSCITTLYYLSHVCYSTCPTGYYGDSSTHLCATCDSRCTACSNSSTNCSACTTSGSFESYLNSASKACVSNASCPTGTYPQSSTHVCTACNLSCSACSGNADNCTGCSGTLYYLSNVCYSTCPTGYYNSGSFICMTCDSHCTACTNSATNCTACTTSGASQSYLNSGSFLCVAAASCPSGTYAQTSTHVCTNCNSPCSTCLNTANNCTGCASTYYLLSNICYSTCPTGYYKSSPVIGQCSICDSRCTECDGPSTNCSACVTSGTYESYLDSAARACVVSTSCPTGTYPQSSVHVCDSCNTSCYTCQNTKHNCTECISGLFYLTNVCYSTCPTGYFNSVPASLKQCVLCDNRCTVCNGSTTNCSSCTTSGTYESFLTGTSCVASTSCPGGTFADTSTHTCSSCNSSCETCLNTLNNCTSCISGLYYLTNICYSICPTGYYNSPSPARLCLTCNARCTVCNVSATNCSACTTSGGFQSFLTGTSCVASVSCPGGTYPESATHICQACNASCATCSGNKHNCTTCASPLYLLSNICYTVCPVNYYGTGGLCVACDPYCMTCTGTQVNECLTCQTSGTFQSFYLSSNTTCYDQCPIGYFENMAGHLCSACHAWCTQCTGNPSPCQACKSTHVYFNQTCLTACPAGYYAANISLPYKVCQPCTEVCLTCFGGSYTQCNTCNYDFVVRRSGNTCQATCASGYGETDSWSVCVACNSKCTSCYNVSTNCTSCKTSGSNEGFIIIADVVHNTGNCYNPCPAGYFGNKTTHFCDKCDPTCTKCNNTATNCTECKPNHYFLNFTCYPICPDGYFINGTNCSQCVSQCLICSEEADNCSLCDPTIPTYLLNNSCIDSCPSGYFQSTNTSNTCQACDIQCLTCNFNSSYCYTCAATYFYFQHKCNESCDMQGYFADTASWRCLTCDSYCVHVDFQMDFSSQLDQAIIVTMTFTQNIDWTTFPMQTFQSFSFSQSFFTEDMFSFNYVVISPKAYQIIITPKLYIFMYNLVVTTTIGEMPYPNLNSSNGRPFHESVYNQSLNVTWSYIKAPVTEFQKQITVQLMNITHQLQVFTNATVVRELIQGGLFSWIMPGVQITSAVILVNGIIPQHMYQAIRIFATTIFYQVPSWQKNAANTRNVFKQKVKELLPETLSSFMLIRNHEAQIRNQEFQQASNIRKLQQMSLNLPAQYRFKRLGFTTFFIIDIYMQILLLAVGWAILLICVKCIYKKDITHKNVRRAYNIFHKINQISLMYVSIALFLQWIYFERQKQNGYRWSSFFMCFVLLLYFLCYELYIYYDMFQYPQAHVNTRSYLMYATKYGHFLKNIRYEQYNINEGWSPKIWFRPYNYHILSFYKKFLMMLCLPIFHQSPYTQASCLIFLQVLEMIRFYVTWPFESQLRNIYRILLQLMLLTLFIIVLATQYLSNLLMLNNPNQIVLVVQWFNALGWIGLIIVFVFNLSIFIILIIDILRLFIKGDSMAQMDQIRRAYYWQKVKKYEDQNQDVDPKVICKWVKLGNLRQLQDLHDQSRYITTKIQKLKIQKQMQFFKIDVNHVVDLRIKKQGFIHEENSRRLKINDKIKKIIEVSRENNREIYNIIKNIYDKYKVEEQFNKIKTEILASPLKDTIKNRLICQLVVETYLKVNLDEYPSGGRVFMYNDHLKHILTLYMNGQKILKFKEENLIQGLPLDKKLLEGRLYSKNAKFDADQ